MMAAKSMSSDMAEVDVARGVVELGFDGEGVEAGKRVTLFFAEELFLAEDLNDLIGILVVFEPEGTLLSEASKLGISSFVNRVDKELNLVTESVRELLNTADGIARLFPASVPVGAMALQPLAFRIVEGRVLLVGTHDLRLLGRFNVGLVLRLGPCDRAQGLIR